MDLTTPAPLTDVIQRFGSKTPIGSKLRTAEWEALPQGFRDRSFFSAGVESVRWLGEAQKRIDDIVQRARATNAKGETYWSADRSKVVAELRQLGKTLGIEHPNGPRKDGKIRENDLTDPLSIRRLKLIVDTQLEMAYGYGEYIAAHDPAVLAVYPCWELVRIRSRKVPRNWRQRWASAGGAFHGGRMIARKDDPIWIRLSRFGNPYPPYDFNSGMGVADVDRDTAVNLGVIEPKVKISPQVETFNKGLESTIANMTETQRSMLTSTFGDSVIIDGETIKWRDQNTVATVPPTPTTPPLPEVKAIPGARTYAEIESLMAEHVAGHAADHATVLQAMGEVDVVGDALTKMQQQLHRNEITQEDYIARRDEHHANVKRLTGTLDGIATRKAARIEAARESLSIPAADRGKVRIQGKVNPVIAAAVSEGVGIVERYTHPDLMPTAEALALPKNRHRAHYTSPAYGRPAGPALMLRQTVDASTVAHELGHAIEDQFRDVLRASLDFLKSRAGGVMTRTLRALTGNRAYSANERAWEDEWVKKGGSVYSGKDYQGIASEILSMGIERLHRDPIAFFTEDPEYFRFVITILQKLIP